MNSFHWTSNQYRATVISLLQVNMCRAGSVYRVSILFGTLLRGMCNKKIIESVSVLYFGGWWRRRVGDAL